MSSGKRGWKKLFAGFAAAVVGCAVFGFAAFWIAHHRNAASGKRQDPGKDLVIPVAEGKALQKDLPIYLDGIGTAQAFNSVTVTSRVDGQLVKVAFEEGQDVKAGDLLFQIDPDPYQAAYEQATAKKGQDEALLANAKLDMERYAKLVATSSVSQQTYDTQKALVAQYEATVKADQAAIFSAKINLDYASVKAPIDGRAGIRAVDIGNIVRANDATGLVVLTQLNPIYVAFTLPETALGALQSKQGKSAFQVLAMSRDGKKTIATGSLSVVNNQIDTTTGTIKMKAVFSNGDLSLWPGQFVNVRLLLETRKNGVVVPASAVQRGPNGAYAFSIGEDQRVKIRPLKVAQIEGGEALIDEGLSAGESIVVDGQYKLREGSKVKAVQAESAPDVQASGDEGASTQKKKQRKQK